MVKFSEVKSLEHKKYDPIRSSRFKMYQLKVSVHTSSNRVSIWNRRDKNKNYLMVDPHTPDFFWVRTHERVCFTGIKEHVQQELKMIINDRSSSYTFY